MKRLIFAAAALAALCVAAGVIDQRGHSTHQQRPPGAVEVDRAGEARGSPSSTLISTTIAATFIANRWTTLTQEQFAANLDAAFTSAGLLGGGRDSAIALLDVNTSALDTPVGKIHDARDAIVKQFSPPG